MTVKANSDWRAAGGGGHADGTAPKRDLNPRPRKRWNWQRTLAMGLSGLVSIAMLVAVVLALFKN